MGKKPTLDEDMSLARSGHIRSDNGDIEHVGLRTAYEIISKRRDQNLYAGPVPSIAPEKNDADFMSEPKDEPVNKGDAHDVPAVKELPDRSDGYNARTAPFQRGDVAVSRSADKSGYNSKSSYGSKRKRRGNK